MRAEDTLRVLRDRLLHPQRRVARPHGVVLVGERRAEQRHDPIAHHLVDGAFVAVDGFHHPLEHGIEQLARFLGVAISEQLHRALQVGEEHGDLLALALEGGLGGEDLLGEVPGGIALRNAESGRGRLGCRTTLGQPVAALLAELHAQLIRRPATRARLLQARTAFLAKDSITGVLVPAPWTGHHTLATPIAGGTAQASASSRRARGPCPRSSDRRGIRWRARRSGSRSESARSCRPFRARAAPSGPGGCRRRSPRSTSS